MRRPVAHHDLGRHADARQRRLLERADVEVRRRSAARWMSRSTSAEATYSTVAKPWLKVRAARSRFEQVLRHRLAGAVVHGELAQDLRLLQPVLVELRRQLDEVGQHAGAGDQRIGHVRQQAVQAVAELVEQRARVVERQQRRLAGRRLVEVHHVDDERADVAGELLLVAERRHPGAAALGRPREIVAEEQRRHGAPSASRHLPGAHVGMPDRDVGARLEAQAEQPVRGVERRLDHVVELEVRLDRRLVDVVARLAQLLGVVAPVPRREREVAALRRDHRLHGVAVGERAARAPAPRPVRAGRARPAGRLRHGVVEPVVREARRSRAASRARRAAPPSRR